MKLDFMSLKPENLRNDHSDLRDQFIRNVEKAYSYPRLCTIQIL